MSASQDAFRRGLIDTSGSSGAVASGSTLSKYFPALVPYSSGTLGSLAFSF